MYIHLRPYLHPRNLPKAASDLPQLPPHHQLIALDQLDENEAADSHEALQPLFIEVLRPSNLVPGERRFSSTEGRDLDQSGGEGGELGGGEGRDGRDEVEVGDGEEKLLSRQKRSRRFASEGEFGADLKSCRTSRRSAIRARRVAGELLRTYKGEPSLLPQLHPPSTWLRDNPAPCHGRVAPRRAELEGVGRRIRRANQRPRCRVYFRLWSIE